MPLHDALSETGVHHVAVQVVARGWFQFSYFASQQRGHHVDAGFLVVLHFPERESQSFCGSHSCPAGEQPQQEQTYGLASRQREVFVQEEVLMANAHLRNARFEKQVSEAREQFIEVDDQVRARFHDAAMEEEYAFGEIGQTEHVIGHAARQVVALIGGSGQEIGALKLLNGHAHALDEELGQLAGVAFAHQSFHDLMSMVAQDVLHGKGLGEMSTAFALYDKEYLHVLLLLRRCKGSVLML